MDVFTDSCATQKIIKITMFTVAASGERAFRLDVLLEEAVTKNSSWLYKMII